HDAQPGGTVTLDTVALPAAHRGTAGLGAPHTVQPGDTLWDIAWHRYGDPGRWHRIWQLNHGRIMPDGRPFTDPHDMLPGLVLRMPAGGRGHAGPPAAATSRHDPRPAQRPGSSPPRPLPAAVGPGRPGQAGPAASGPPHAPPPAGLAAPPGSPPARARPGPRCFHG